MKQFEWGKKLSTLIGLAAGCWLFTAAAMAQEPSAAPLVPHPDEQIVEDALAADDDELVTINFVNADIDSVVRFVSETTGRNFIIDPKVKGTISIVSKSPIKRSLVYQTLLSALRLQGVTAIESDGVTRIVMENEAKQYSTVKNGRPVITDGMITKVIPLKYESSAPMVAILRPMGSPSSAVLSFANTNTLVVTDYAENIRRMEKVIDSIDQPPANEPEMIELKNASALDMLPMLNKLLAEGQPNANNDPQNKLTLVADGRTNSIIVRSENPGRVKRVRDLIKKLDNSGRPGGNFFIIYLKNADANTVAQTLQGLLTGNSINPNAQAKPTTTSQQNSGLNTAMSNAAGADTTALPFTTTQNNVSFTANGVTVQADSATNSIVVMAPEPVYNTIRSVVEKLDVARAQVFIEALIVEIEADKAAEFGIQWQVLTDKTGEQFIGGTNFGSRNGSGQNILDPSFNIGYIGQGLNLGLLDGTVSLGGRTLLNLGVLARALETQTKANILSTPTLLTLDNQEAKIMVGQNIPVMTGQYSSLGTSSTQDPFTTVDRQDVGLMLRIKPQILENGSVRLNIYQEVSRVQEYASGNPILSKRSLESSVAVDDTQIVVLGGLIEDRMTDGQNKVPLLGDIPLLGNLFRYDTRSRKKSNLMIFLKPTIVRAGADAQRYTTERYRYLMGEQERLRPQDRFFWTDPTIPELLPQGLLPGSEKPLPPVERGEPLPSGAMLIPLTPFIP